MLVNAQNFKIKFQNHTLIIADLEKAQSNKKLNMSTNKKSYSSFNQKRFYRK